MIVHVANRGHSFKGAGLYYLHDKKASTSERVAWAHTHNLPTDDPDKGLKWMSHTAMSADRLKEEAGVARAGRKASAGCVYAFALSWHPEQKPGREQMMSAAFETLERLGLKEHEAVMVAHRDTDHPHVHVICNLVNPQDGRTAVPSYDRLTLSTWAQEHETENGKIYCEERVKNNEQRRAQAKEERQLGMVKHREERLETAQRVQEIYSRSDSGKAFQAALQEAGFTLARGDRRGFVLVDETGKIYSLSRQLEGQRAKDISARLSNIDQEALPQAKTVVQERQYFDRDRYEAEWQKGIVDAAIEEENRRGMGEKKKEQERPAEPTRTQEQPAGDQVRREQAAQPQPENERRAQDDFLKHLDRLRAWEQAQDRKRHQLEKELAEFYGREKIAEKLRGLQEQLAKSDTFLGRMTGRVQELQDEVDGLAKSLANVDSRIAERRGSLEAEIEKSREREFSPAEKERRLDIEQRRQRQLEALREQADKKLDRSDRSHDLSR